MFAPSGYYLLSTAFLWLAGHTLGARLDLIELPVGFEPEGIALGEEWTVYVGSFNDGSIWKGDLSSGEGKVVLSDVGGGALGLKYDRRSGYLFVAGGSNDDFDVYTDTLDDGRDNFLHSVHWPQSTARVYDTKDFRLIADIQLASDDLPAIFNMTTFVNDVVLTKTAAYLTDSIQPQLYKVPLDKDSGELADGKNTTVVTLPYGSEFNIVYTGPNANGIEVTEDEETLIMVNMAAGELYTVNPETGEVSLIDLGGVSVYGDGLVLRKNTLWVVENGYTPGGTSRIVEIALSSNLSCGSVVRNLTSEYFDDPSTAVLKGPSLYAVNAKFETTATYGADATPFEIVRVDRDAGEGACSSA